MTGKARQETFRAWINKMPRADNTLYVTGEIEYPTGGWKAKLVEADVPKVPSTLVLDVVETAPTGMVTQVISFVPVRFEKPKSPDYATVTIRGAGPDFTVEVKPVH
jgi:hypothetical protein